MEQIKTIKVVVSEKAKDGKKFNVYETFDKKGNRMTLKFVRDINELPTETCYAKVKTENMSVDRRKEYPVLWVKEVVEYVPLKEVSANKNKEVIDELFD